MCASSPPPKRSPKHRMIVLAMGELGFPTRVLSPVFGGVFTYAAPLYAEGTAAGQVSARYLRHLYRVEKLRQIRQDLRRDRRPDPPLHLARRAQPRISIAARGCRLSAVPGLPGVSARFLLDGRQAPARRFQRHHSAQAEDHPLPGCRGSPGAAHRRGQHRLAQGRQMARHQYRRCRRHRSALPPAADLQTPRC